MKSSISNTIIEKTLKGSIHLELKYISSDIEWKFFVWENQLNLRMEKTKYKIKDLKERRDHANDFLKKKVQDYMIKKILDEMKRFNNNAKLENIKVVWWTH